MKHWSDVYPHDLHASVCLLDNKIYNFKVGNHYWEIPGQVRMRYDDFDKIGQMNIEHKTWTVQNDYEHNQVFEKLSTEWFKNWEVHENHVGRAAY